LPFPKISHLTVSNIKNFGSLANGLLINGFKKQFLPKVILTLLNISISHKKGTESWTFHGFLASLKGVQFSLSLSIGTLNRLMHVALVYSTEIRWNEHWPGTCND